MLGELMRWNPAQELSNLHRDIDELFGRFFDRSDNSSDRWMPRIETYRKENEYVVRLDLPGIDPKDVQVHAEGNVLTISGERKSQEEGPVYRETFFGDFQRQIALPQGVEAEKISAHYEHGVLEIRVPLPPQLVGRQVPIEVGQEKTKKLESKAA